MKSTKIRSASPPQWNSQTFLQPPLKVCGSTSPSPATSNPIFCKVMRAGRQGGSNPLFFTSPLTCICSILFFDSLLEYSFAIIATGISYSHVRIAVALTHQEEFVCLCSTTINMIPYSFLFDDILSFQAQEKRCAIWLMVGKENQMHHDATIGPGSQAYKEQIPKVLGQQTMAGPTKGLYVTTGVQN
jgi:hypothetical protein